MPNQGEEHGAFLQRCMGDQEAMNSFPKQDQRYAFCNSQWMRHMKDQSSAFDIKNFILEIKNVDGKKGIVSGYFAAFDNVDSEGDVIKSGAFARTIQGMGPSSPKPRIKHLINHNPEQPLGMLLSLKEDSKGLAYESKIGTHSLGRDFLLMAESGLITEHSIGYKTMKFNQVTPWDEYKDGDVARELTELKLYEGSSLTAWGANPETPLTGIKSAFEKANKIDKFCRNSKATDQTIEQLLEYNKQLLESIKDLQTTQDSPDPASDSPIEESEITQPEVVECPKCKKLNYNTKDGSAIKCRNCNKVFLPGLNFSFTL